MILLYGILADSSMNKGELDVSYITSRLIVMSYPAEGMESAIKNHIDDVREFLEANHPGSYTVYNLSNRSYRTAKFHNRVSYQWLLRVVFWCAPSMWASKV